MGIIASILKPITTERNVDRTKQVQSRTSDESFRFLDLPPELRCMVYEYLEIGVRRHTLTNTEPSWCPCWKPTSDESDANIILIRPYLPVAILSTCRLINQEAAPLLDRKLRELEKIPLQFFLSYGGAYCLTQGRLLASFSASSRSVSADNNKQVEDFMARCSTFLTHTRHLPRNAISRFDVELIITSNNQRKQGIEFISAVMGTHDQADKSGLAFSFGIRDAYPTLSRKVREGTFTQLASGDRVFRNLSW
jgi:hypothetical protein